MRPRRLVIEGLRSFRDRVEVDFGDRRLVAIVGHTGAGKSSLLEAITYALYGGATWTALHGDLISDTADHMLVELTFDSGGKRYRLRRTASRTTRPSTAELVNETDGTAIDNVRPVDDAVHRLVGLKRDAFLKSVILPQGRFAEMLYADGVKRNAVLENIFRIDEIRHVRDHAKTIRDRVSPGVEGLRQRRMALPEDPAATISDGRSQAAATAATANHVGIAVAEATQTAQRLEGATSTVRKLTEVGSSLAKLDLNTLLSRLSTLTELEEELSALALAAEALNKERTASLAALKTRRDKMFGASLDSGALAVALTRLEELEQLLPEISKETTDLQSDLDGLARDEALTGGMTGTLAASETATKSAKDEVGRNADEQASLRENLDVARQLLVALLAADESAVEAEAALQAALSVEADSALHTQAADQQLEEALAAHQAGRQRLAALEQKHAAAHAAAHVGPGDPCPVCQRRLEADFTPPQAEGLAEIRSATEGLERSLEAARKDAAKASQARTHARQSVESVKSTQAETATQRDLAVSALVAHPGVLATEVGTANEALLSPLEAQFETSQVSGRASEALLAQALEAEAAAGEKLRRHEQHLIAERKRLEAADTHLERRRTHAARSLAEIPPSLRPEPSPKRDDPTIDLTHLDAEAVARARLQTLQHIESLNAMGEEIERVQADIEAARTSLDGVIARRDAELTRPVAVLREQASEAVQAIRSAAVVLDSPVPEVGLSEDRSASTLAADLAKTAVGQAGLLENADSALNEARGLHASAQARLTDLFDGSGVADLAALNETKVDAEVEAKTAVARLDAARDAAAAAEELNAQLAGGSQLVDDLDELRKLLGSRTFVGEILKQRSRALLAVAGQRLIEMTGERYAFTPDFGILDQLTGQPRDAKTLSGGESFLASLALALGMVDLAARSGGRLDALLLDEGFGALDAGSLHSAVDALEATSQAGRMVVVISHLKAVAERIDDVLVVSSTPRGSKVAWLDAAALSEFSGGDALDALERLLD